MSAERNGCSLRIHLRYVAAPLVDQSDLPWRLMTAKYGATCTYSQMYQPHELLSSREVLEQLQLDLQTGRSDPRNKYSDGPLSGQSKPQIVQLAGRDADALVHTARALDGYADGIDLNLGCPQRHASLAGIGAYMTRTAADRQLTESIVASLSHSLRMPVSVKIRLATNESDTPDFAVRLARAGASCVALHARHVVAKQRRRGPAHLHVVKDVVQAIREDGLEDIVAVISNGNVRTYEDVEKNLTYTAADGVMVGEALLENPSLFRLSLSPSTPSPALTPLDLADEYLSMCTEASILRTAPTLKHVKQHVRYMLSSERLYPPSKERAHLLAAVQDAPDVQALRCVVEKEHRR